MRSKAYITGYGDKKPFIHKDAFIDISARIIGDVLIAEGASIWPMAVLRADSAAIRIGRGSAVLDLALIEAPDGYPVVIEEEAIVSHGSMIHGSHICSGVLIGMGAIVLEGAIVSSGSIAGAGCLITAGMTIPPNSLIMGVPGKVVRQTTPGEREGVDRQVKELYSKSRGYTRSLTSM